MRNFKMISAGPLGKNKDYGGVDFGVSFVFSDTIIMDGRDQNYQANMLLNTTMKANEVVESLRLLANHLEEHVVNEPAMGKLKLAVSNKD